MRKEQNSCSEGEEKPVLFSLFFSYNGPHLSFYSFFPPFFSPLLHLSWTNSLSRKNMGGCRNTHTSHMTPLDSLLLQQKKQKRRKTLDCVEKERTQESSSLLVLDQNQVALVRIELTLMTRLFNVTGVFFFLYSSSIFPSCLELKNLKWGLVSDFSLSRIEIFYELNCVSTIIIWHLIYFKFKL